jgi:hypothetical protein
MKSPANLPATNRSSRLCPRSHMKLSTMVAPRLLAEPLVHPVVWALFMRAAASTHGTRCLSHLKKPGASQVADHSRYILP